MNENSIAILTGVSLFFVLTVVGIRLHISEAYRVRVEEDIV